MNDTHRFRIGKIHISKTNPEHTKQRLTEAALNGEGGYVCVTNIRMINYADKHPEYVELMENSFMNLPDGTPLTWLGKAWGLKNIEVTNGPSTFNAILSSGDKRLKHFLLGDTEEVLNEIENKYRSEFDAQIVGTYSLPFVKVEDFDYHHISRMVIESGANMVWTAMTAPKQDEFNKRLFKYIPNVVSIGVGRAFRLSIGEVKDAPVWAKKIGIGGIFMRRISLFGAVKWYLTNIPKVMKYYVEIKYWKSMGKNCKD